MIRLAAPAKLNLHLRVFDPRGDGFHSIESLFVTLGLRDDVEIELAPGGIEFRATGDYEVPHGADNLCVAAAASFFDEIGREAGARIRLAKRIPVAAGLGGGSSDAASVLLGLNHLHGEPLKQAELADVGVRTGSDVPFFLLQQPFALGRGRGEELSTLPPPPARPVLIVDPGFGVSARDAYAWRREAAGSAGVELVAQGDLASIGDLADWSAIAGISTNDLAAGVFAHHPALAKAREALAETGAFMSLLCGSGACLAGIYDDDAIRDSSAEQLRSHLAIPATWRLISTGAPG